MRTADFDFPLPDRLIAQTPIPERDQSRLMVLDRSSGNIAHRHFPNLLGHLQPGDVLVLNNSKVIPARLRAQRASTAGQVEILLAEETELNRWWAMARPAKRLRAGTTLQLLDRAAHPTFISAEVLSKNPEGHVHLQFSGVGDIKELLGQYGQTPLPPYIQRPENPRDKFRYQTVFAEAEGSIAAPTAGLHFTLELLRRIEEKGVHLAYITLHVGLGTFAPVKADRVADHVMHEERFDLEGRTVELIQSAKRSGRNVVAVGTTTLRVLESVAGVEGELRPTRGQTRLFIRPPFEFKVVDRLLTNFHLPQSTLLMLVSAFASPGGTSGREWVLSAYAEAVRQDYRFFSYGDAMLIL